MLIQADWARAKIHVLGCSVHGQYIGNGTGFPINISFSESWQAAALDFGADNLTGVSDRVTVNAGVPLVATESSNDVRFSIRDPANPKRNL
jgi:hypothetical protein